MKNPLSPRSGKLLLLVLAASVQATHADIRFITGASPDSQARLEAAAAVRIKPNPETNDPSPVFDGSMPPEEFEFMSYEESISAFAKKEGLTAQSRAAQSTKISATANLLTCTSIGSTEGKATRTGDPLKDDGTRGEGLSVFRVSFSVDGSSSFTITGSGSADSEFGSAEVRLHGIGQDPDDEEADLVELEVKGEASGEPGKPRSFSVSKSGRIGAGSYTLSVSCFAFAGGSQPTSKSKFSVNLRVTSFPTELEPLGGEFHWIRRGTGAFTTAANWIPQAVPGSEDTAFFDLRGAYTVTHGGSQQTVDRIRLKSGGTMTLSGGTLAADSTALDAPSFIATGNARLTIPVGGTLATVAAILGNDAGSFGEVKVMGSGATWRSSGVTVGGPLTELFTIGGAGTGRLTVSGGGFLLSDDAIVGGGTAPGFATITGEGSRWNTENLTVGNPTEGTLSILDGGLVSCVRGAKIGSGAGSNTVLPSVRVQGTARSGSPSHLLVSKGILLVGADVPGSLEIFDGALVEVPDGPESFDGFLGIDNVGQVLVRGVRAAGSLRATLDVKDVSIQGEGFLNVEAGGLVRCSGSVFVGGPNGRGDVTVEGVSPTGFASELEITAVGHPVILGGNQTDGVLNILNSGTVSIVCSEMQIGSGVGHGIVNVISSNPARPESFLSVTGTLKIPNPAGGATGLLRITDSTVEVLSDVFVGANGAISGTGVLSVSGTLHNSGTISPGLSPGILKIEGNFEQDATGVVVAEVGGPNAGTQHDQFIVTGNSTMGGKLVVQFINGYAPKAGDHFSVLSTTGAATGAFAAVEVGGLEPGAQFQTASSGGVLTATAMNDTTALQTVSIRAVGKKAFEKRRRAAAILVSRKGTKASKANPLTVNFAVAGTAENGIDYALLTGIATIPALKSAVVLKLTPFDDSSPEEAETVELEIIPGTDYSNSLRSKTKVTIVNNKSPKR